MTEVSFVTGCVAGILTTWLLCLSMWANTEVYQEDILLAQKVCQDHGVKWIDKPEFMCNDGATYNIKDLKERFNK